MQNEKPEKSQAKKAPAPHFEIQPGATADPKHGLEEIVRLTNKVGLDYAEAKKNIDRLELMKPTVRAQISIRLDKDKLSEAKLRRLTETDPEYVAYLEKMIEARDQFERMRVRYESYKNLFEARRSLLSYQKAELKLL